MFLGEGAHHMSQGLDTVPLSAPSHEGSEQAKDSGCRASSWGHQPLYGFLWNHRGTCLCHPPKRGRYHNPVPMAIPCICLLFRLLPSDQGELTKPTKSDNSPRHCRTSWRIWKRLTHSPFIFEAQPKLFVGPPLSVFLPCVSSSGGPD